jgi:hypothetical protein
MFDAPENAGMPGSITYSALPSADPDDGRFFGIAGSGLSTLAGISVVAYIGVPAGSSYFHIGIFDGDQGGIWDSDGSDVTIYRLYKDPLKNGTTDHIITNWLSLNCFDDDWYNRNFTVDSEAQAPSGNYFYRLEVDWRDGIPVGMINNFKIRTTGQISLAAGQWFGFDGGPQRIAGFSNPPYDPCVGSGDPNPGEQNDPDANSYDGKWRFSFYVPKATNRVVFWDGDSDRWDDSDDPNTPAYPANPLPEGANPGAPADDGTPYGVCAEVNPSIFNAVDDPDGRTFTNLNPSGNSEREMFSIGNLADDDHTVNFTLSPGLWTYRVYGMDSHNFNFMKTTYELYAYGDDPPLPVNPPPEVEPDQAVQVLPDDTYFLNHTVTNKGVEQAFDLKAESNEGWETHVWEDTDQDGVYDLGEPEIIETGLLAEDEVYHILVSVEVPSGSEGITDHVDITASSQIEWAIQDTAQDTVDVWSNQPPEATAGGPYVGYEGSPVTFDGSGSSDPDGDAIEYRWDVDGDGTWDTSYSTSPTYTHTWDDDWTGTVILEVTDGQETDEDSASVTIFNVAPTPEWTSESSDGTILNPPYPEGMEILFTATVSDPGIYDTFTYDWDFGDGSTLLDAGPSVTHAYGDNNLYIVVLTVTDDDNGVGIDDTPPLETTNEDPVASIAMPFCIFTEGTDPCEPIGVFTDPGWLDTHTALWEFGDGTSESATLTEENNPPDSTGTSTASHVYGDDGTYVITFTVWDDDGGMGSASAEAQVVNLAPTVDATLPPSISEAEDFVLTVTASDPGSDDLTISLDWGDGSTETVTYYNDGVGPDPPNSPGGVHPFTITEDFMHVYGDNGDFTVTITVSDDDGGVTVEETVVTVNNVAPTVAGVSYYLNASFAFRIAGEKWHNVEIHLYEDGTEVGYANITRYPGSPNEQMADFGEFSIDFSKTYSAIAYYTPEDDPINGQIWGATPAWVILEYEDGEERIHHTFNVRHEDTWTWEIDDFSPYFLGHNITFMATASDPGSDDQYSFSTAGTHTVTLTVTDDDDGVSSYTFNLGL